MSRLNELTFINENFKDFALNVGADIHLNEGTEVAGLPDFDEEFTAPRHFNLVLVFLLLLPDCEIQARRADRGGGDNDKGSDTDNNPLLSVLHGYCNTPIASCKRVCAIL